MAEKNVIHLNETYEVRVNDENKEAAEPSYELWNVDENILEGLYWNRPEALARAEEFNVFIKAGFHNQIKLMNQMMSLNEEEEDTSPRRSDGPSPAVLDGKKDDNSSH